MTKPVEEQTPLEADSPPQPESVPSPLEAALADESGWFRTHRSSPFISGGVALLIILALIYRTVFKEVRNDTLDLRILVIASLIGAAIIGAIVAFSYIFWRTTYFKLSPEFLFRKSGRRNKESVQIELAAVDGADLKRGLFAKLLGLAELNVRPAAGDPISIAYLPLAQCKQLRARILHAAPLDKAADAEVNDAPDIDVTEVAEANGGAGLGSPSSLARHNNTHGEQQLYTLPRRRHVWSLAYPALYTGVPTALVLLVAALTALAVIDLPTDFWAWPPEDVSPASLVLQALLLVVAGAIGLTKLLSKHHRSTLTLDRGKLTTQRGLVSDVASTITLTKINWVEINQPFAWRRADWWRLKVRSLTSMDEDDDSDDDEKSSEVLAPVATPAEMTTLLNLLEAQTGVAAQLVLGLCLRAAPLDLVSSRRARKFNPLTYGRNGVALTDTALLVRTGRFTTRVTVIPFARIQGCSLSQGPLQRRHRLGNMSIHGAGKVGDCEVANLDFPEASALFETVLAAVREVK